MRKLHTILYETRLSICPIIVDMKNFIGMCVRYVDPLHRSVYPQPIGPFGAVRDDDGPIRSVHACSLY